MSNLQIIEALCALVEKQASIINHFARHLAEAHSLSEAERQMVDAAMMEYSAILGADEVPDNITEED